MSPADGGRTSSLTPIEGGRWNALATSGQALTSQGRLVDLHPCETCGSTDTLDGQCFNPLHDWEPKPETGDLFRDVLVLTMQEAA